MTWTAPAAGLVRPAERAQVPAVPPGSCLHRRDGPEDAGDGRAARRRRAAAALPARALRRRPCSSVLAGAALAAVARSTCPACFWVSLSDDPVDGPGPRWPRSSPTTARRSPRRCWPQPGCSRRISPRPPALAHGGQAGSRAHRRPHAVAGRRRATLPTWWRAAARCYRLGAQPPVVRTAAGPGPGGGDPAARRRGAAGAARTH